ncbi:MAG: DegT/DnrJ/EryC1/StrS family aminotransferase [Candidatus Zipacnadales bacterium]
MPDVLAIDGGVPLRTEPFPPWPYFSEETIQAAMEPLREGKPNYWTGPRGLEFQRKFADFCGVKHGIAVNSGTSALHVACGALGLGPGDEVITPSYTFIASAMCVIQQNAVPVFADIDPQTHTISPDDIRAKITPQTKAIIAVHLYGHPCDMDAIMQIAEEHGLWVIEDCAQAHGAEYKGRGVGSIGHINAFSFCQDKIFTTGGEGGMVTTNDDNLARNACAFKDHGFWEEERRDLLHRESLYLYIHHQLGFNYRMTEMQSAIGLKELEKLTTWHLPRRARNAEAITEQLEGVPGLRLPIVRPGCKHAWYKYPIILDLDVLSCDRDQFVKAVRAEGYPGAAVGDWPENYRENVFVKRQGYGPTGCPLTCPHNKRVIDYSQVYCPNAADVGRRTIKLQVHPTMEPEDAADIGRIVRKVAEAYAR